jgi:hypothetical protein
MAPVGIMGSDRVPGHFTSISRIAASRNRLFRASSSPLKKVSQIFPRLSDKSMAEAISSSSFTPFHTAACRVILKAGPALACCSKSSSLLASMCKASCSATIRRVIRKSLRSPCDGSGTSKAATVLALSGCGATPHADALRRMGATRTQRMELGALMTTTT